MLGRILGIWALPRCGSELIQGVRCLTRVSCNRNPGSVPGRIEPGFLLQVRHPFSVPAYIFTRTVHERRFCREQKPAALAANKKSIMNIEEEHSGAAYAFPVPELPDNTPIDHVRFGGRIRKCTQCGGHEGGGVG